MSKIGEFYQKSVKPYFTKELLYITVATLSYLGFVYTTSSYESVEFLKRLFGFEYTGPDADLFHFRLIWFWLGFVFLMLIPMVFAWIVEGKDVFKKMGFGLAKNKKVTWVVLGALLFMFICEIIGVHLFPTLHTYYPQIPYATETLGRFIFYEINYFLFFICWEFFSHGFLLFPFEKKFGKAGAILIGLMPFVVLHIGKPVPEVFGSLIATVFLSILAMETKSFWYGVFLHGAAAVLMEITSLYLYFGA